jgi:hypothetical protein
MVFRGARRGLEWVLAARDWRTVAEKAAFSRRAPDLWCASPELSKLTRVQRLAVVLDLANEPVEPRMPAAGGDDVSSLQLGQERQRPAASRDSIHEEKEAGLCEEAPVIIVPRQGCLDEDAHGLGPAPGG